MASTGRSAFSQDGQYYAFCGNDGKLKIWETASGRLKHEYIPNRHLSSPCSVIGWISVSPQSAGNVSVNERHVLSNSRGNSRRFLIRLFFHFIYEFTIRLSLNSFQTSSVLIFLPSTQYIISFLQNFIDCCMRLLDRLY